jgi:hypothetical protein
MPWDHFCRRYIPSKKIQALHFTISHNIRNFISTLILAFSFLVIPWFLSFWSAIVLQDLSSQGKYLGTPVWILIYYIIEQIYCAVFIEIFDLFFGAICMCHVLNVIIFADVIKGCSLWTVTDTKQSYTTQFEKAIDSRNIKYFPG